LNLILFQPAEVDRPLPINDFRAAHLLNVLRRGPGDTFDVGLINGPLGKGTLREVTPDHLILEFRWGPPPPPPDPVILIIGLPRPQTARKILSEATSLGVTALHFVQASRTEPSYAESTLWRSGEWKRHLEAGAAQAFCTRVPAVSYGQSLAEAVSIMPSHNHRIALDNYEAPNRLSDCQLMRDIPVVCALGPERGWTTEDREILRANGFAFAHLGTRVLRLETAVVAALALLKASRGLM
jgi:16S rRNA (uracil1498-N3)-methyltransferase